MRPGLVVLALVALAAVVGVGLLLLGSPRPEHGAFRAKIGPKRVETGATSPVPNAMTPAELTEGAQEALAPAAPGEDQPEARAGTGTIRGRVVGAPPEILGGLEVLATPVEEDAPVRIARTDKDGCFVLVDVDERLTYDLKVVVAGRASYGRRRTEMYRARAGPRELELVWLPERALVFQVADARTGATLSDFEVRLGSGYGRPMLDDEGRIRRHFLEGRVRWVAWAEEEERSPFELVVSARGYREQRIGPLVASSHGDLELGRLLLEPMPRLVVTVLEAASRAPIEGARVTLVHAVDQHRAGGSTAFDPHDGRTAANGQVLLSCFPGEEARLEVRHAGFVDLVKTLQLTLAEEQRETVQLARR